MADTPPLKLLIDGVEIFQVGWNATTEEVLGGTGRFKLEVQDRTNTWEPVAHQDIKILIRASNWVLGRGEILRDGIHLKVQDPFRTWVLDCADYNIELPQRKVGALDGKTWIDTSGMGFFINIDPFATSLDTDRLTVQQLFDHYVRVAGNAIETSTYVGEYLTELGGKLTWERSDVQRALEEMAAYVVQNLQFWLDPDLFFHWVVIPAWQDILQRGVIVQGDPTKSLTAAGFAELAINSTLLPNAPYRLDGADGSANGTTVIGFQDLDLDYDGSDMPQQVYVNGGTGYVYNSPGPPTDDTSKTVVKPPQGGVHAVYSLNFLGSTKLWQTDGTGYISTSFTTASAGGPYDVKWVKVPWSEARHKGGAFWKLLTGPYSGKLVDNDTNILSGYGSIKVSSKTEPPTAAAVGIGGSGWVNEVDQDPNKRQAYLELPISVTKSLRDSFGGQALYRGSTPTLRGKLKVHGYDGWRVGQLIQISDVRLPAAVNGMKFVIQRVSSSLLPETVEREYNIDYADGPASRWSGKPIPTFGPVEWPPPAIMVDIRAFDLSPGPGSTQIIVGQLVNGVGEPWDIEGKVVEWSFECYNSLGVLQTGQGSINPEVSHTDKHGRARTKLTTGAGLGLVYYMFAHVKAE